MIQDIKQFNYKRIPCDYKEAHLGINKYMIINAIRVVQTGGQFRYSEGILPVIFLKVLLNADFEL